ncbi:MAG: ABC transporter substrate-binding protein, partial [Chloroflexi bacterium]|nr:ABC transporter substrate-binding protein [Chloroflexota bacterium]
ISPSATSPALSTANDNGYLFRTTISDAAQGAVLARLAAEEGLTNVGVLFRDDAYGQGLADTFTEVFDGDVAAVAYGAKGQSSYLAELQQAAAGGADVLVAIAFPEEAQVFLREAIEQELFARFLFVDGTRSQELIEASAPSTSTAPGARRRAAARPTRPATSGTRRTWPSTGHCPRCRSCARRTTP